MTSARKAGIAAAFLLMAAGAWAYQQRRSSYLYEREMQNPSEDPPDAETPGDSGSGASTNSSG